MKKTREAFVSLAAVAAMFVAGSVLADSYGIVDTGDGAYYGAAYGSNPPDVIGAVSDFEIFGANLSFLGSVLTVNIHTNFAGKGDDDLFAGNAVPTNDPEVGIGYGDVFLGGQWTPYGTANHYKTDNALNGTIWQYGLALDNRNTDPSAAAKGTLTLYGLQSFDPLNPNRNDYLKDVRLSDEFIVNAGFRHDQEVAVNTASSGVHAIRTGEWWIDGSWVNFQIDLAGTGLLSSEEIALHWALTCANDVIEGSVPQLYTPTSVVPIPAAAWLFGSALAGLFGFTRRKKVAA